MEILLTLQPDLSSLFGTERAGSEAGNEGSPFCASPNKRPMWNPCGLWAGVCVGCGQWLLPSSYELLTCPVPLQSILLLHSYSSHLLPTYPLWLSWGPDSPEALPPAA